jgi:hypothetical protein
MRKNEMPAKFLAGRGKLRPLGVSVPIPDAIATKRLLQLVYYGYPRTVEPHTYGIDANGRLALVEFQVAGSSHSGEYVGWKTFRGSEMRDVVVLERHFPAPRPEYRRNDGAFVSVISQL